MNWKLLVGKAVSRADAMLLKLDLNFVKKNYPYRRNWIFDLKRTFDNAKIILDVGAYVGEVSIELNKWFPMAKIYAFEPVKESFEKLQKSTQILKNILSFNIALGDKNQTTVIPIYSCGTINTLKDAQYDEVAKLTQEIKVFRLDEFLSENKITGVIDILKIDVEGYEFEVLNGVGDYLQNIKFIVTEVGYQRTTTKTHFSDMDIFMESNNFELFNIYDLMPTYNNRTKLSYSNNVYINKRLL